MNSAENDKLNYLAARIAEYNDQLAFNELVRQCFPRLLSFAVTIVKDRHEAEDVLQDVFLKLWEIRTTLPAITHLARYLYVATRNACIGHLRTKKKIYYNDFEGDYLYTLQTPENSLISKQNLSEINSAVQSLPPRCRLIFRLVKDEKLKYKEVAELLNLSVKTVEAQMTIANKTLVEAITKCLPEYGSGLPLKKAR